MRVPHLWLADFPDLAPHTLAIQTLEIISTDFYFVLLQLINRCASWFPYRASHNGAP